MSYNQIALMIVTFYKNGLHFVIPRDKQLFLYIQIDEDSEGKRHVTLTNNEKLKVLSGHIAELVQNRYPPGLSMNEVGSAFLWQYGYALKPETYGCDNLQDLIAKLHSTVKVCIVFLQC